MNYARRNPGRVDALVLLNTAAFRSSRIPPSIRLCRTPIFGPLAVRGLNLFVRGALHMAVTNQGSDLVTFVVVAKYKFFRLALQDGAGAEVPLTRFGKRLVAEPARRKRLTPVKPGISIGHLYDLARIFDMSEAGNYVLTVTNRVLFDSGPETLQVEKIPLVIREPTDKEYEAWK